MVLDQNGAFDGNLSIDTTQLSNGPHKLLVRADSDWPTGKLSGAYVIPFEVQNAAPPTTTTTTARTRSGSSSSHARAKRP